MRFVGETRLMALVDAAGDVAGEYRYGPYGQMLTASETGIANPFRFSTKFLETAFASENETLSFGGGLDLYDCGFRWYHAGLGRWTARDPIGVAGGANLYSFVENSAPGTVDVLGLKCYKLKHTIGIGGFRKNGIVGDDRGTDPTHSAKGMGVGFHGEGEMDLSVEVCDCGCPDGKRGYNISGEVLASLRIGASLATYSFVADITLPILWDMTITAGVNAWVGARVYGQIYGKTGVEIRYSTCGGPPSLDFKFIVGGEFGVEFGGEATAYVKFRRGWARVSKRWSVGIAGGGRAGVEWEPDVSCNLWTCTLSGPVEGYAEGYLRAVFLGVDADFAIGGRKELGNLTVVTRSPINPLRLLY